VTELGWGRSAGDRALDVVAVGGLHQSYQRAQLAAGRLDRVALGLGAQARELLAPRPDPR
jgi:hypothetical protein